MAAMLNVKELSEATGGHVSPYTFRSWIRQGRLPVIRLGRRIMVKAEDFERFVSENRVPAREPGR
ncbi:MAG: helix-turn-helix domain-containing protein [candidate division NC10 bacterium]|nr:helix-turn-helix domain-containing protein [candidate division NC10 bacterium]